MLQKHFCTYRTAVYSLLWAVILVIIMGIVGTQKLLSAWYITLAFIGMMICLGLTIMRVLSECLSSRNRGKALLHRLPFFINHLGLFIAIVAATLGSVNMQQMQMVCYLDRPEWRAVGYDIDVNSNTDRGKIIEMPFAIELHKFVMEEYESGMPKRFASDVTVYARESSEKSLSKTIAQGVIEVNKPLDVNGWKVYQSGYDSMLGEYSPYSIFDLVKDPWLPVVYVGIYLLLIGAVIMIIQAVVSRSVLCPLPKGIIENRARGRIITVVAIVLAFSVMAYFFIPIMTNKELLPALQSIWFVPHVLVYMFAYTLLAATVLLALWEIIMRPKASIFPIIDNLVYAGTALISIGMLFGALWAKEAWGHYWSWDPKETWAAITWFAYLIYIHYRKLSPRTHTIPILILILSFILLNMCWWGINYLPSAQGMSVHTY